MVFRICFLCYSCFVIIFSGLLISISGITGFGTQNNPFKITNENQLIHALNSSKNYILLKDITLTQDISNISFAGYLNGNNHTLIIKQLPEKYLLKKNSGKISNLNIEYPSSDITINTSLSLLTEENSGTINNLNII